MLALVTIIVVYIAVSVYGVVRDFNTGSTVFVITSNLTQAQDINRRATFLVKMKEYFYPPARVVVPVERQVSIKGRVIYTNGVPFSHSPIELRSVPRITYTDSDGYFIFENVDEGDHTLSVLDRNGKVLASCRVTIDRNTMITDAVLRQRADLSFVLEVAVDVKIMEIALEIELDASGRPTGKLIIDPEVRILERYSAEERTKQPPDKQPPEGNKPVPEPDKPDMPSPAPPSPGTMSPGTGGGTNGGNVSDEDRLTVYSTLGYGSGFHKAPAPAADINIFGDNKRIAPGMSGVYKFTVDNTANTFAVDYHMDFTETNNSLNIPMKYRLYDNTTNAYVNGDTNWHTAAEISAVTANPAAPLSMNGSMKTRYNLEWLWEDGGSTDNSYAEDHAGEVVCTFKIQVSARRK